MFIVFSHLKGFTIEGPQIHFTVVEHVLLGTSYCNFGLVGSKDNSVPFAVMTDNVDDCLELPWISGKDVRVISYTDAGDTDRADPEAEIRGVSGDQTWINVGFKVSCSALVSLA